MPKHKTLPVLNNVCLKEAKDNPYFAVNDLETVQVQAFKLIDGTYPSVETHIKPYGKPHHRVTFQVSTLMKLLQTLEKMEVKFFKMSFNDNPEDSVKIESPQDKVQGVIMPCKLTSCD